MNEIVTALIGLLGVVIGIAATRLNNRAALKTQRHGIESTAETQRRTEVLQMIRWAGEQAASSDPATSEMGIAVLQQLATSGLARDSELGYLFAIMRAVRRVELDYTVSNDEGSPE